MVADHFATERGRKLYACEWRRVLEITMNNDLTRDKGTSTGKLKEGFHEIGLETQILGHDIDGFRTALADGHPVVIKCLIPFEDKGVRHYAVLVAMDDDGIFLADPFPHPITRKDGLRAVSRVMFDRDEWSKGSVVWGPDRWAIAVFLPPGETGE
jgi:hypothetical protein